MSAIVLLIASRGYAAGPAGVGRADPMAFDLSSYLEPGGGGDRRRGPSVDGADDLAAIDALQVDAGDAKVGMPKLTLDDHEWNALVRHLDRMSMTELVFVPTSAQCTLSRPGR